MARFIGGGVQDAIAELDEMSGRMLDICKMAVYSGAHVEFEAIKQQISALDDSAINQHGRAELLAGLSSSKLRLRADVYPLPLRWPGTLQITRVDWFRAR